MKKMKTKLLAILLAAVLILPGRISFAETEDTAQPSGEIQTTDVADAALSLSYGEITASLTENKDNGTFYFTVERNNQVVLDASSIGILTEDELSQNLELVTDSVKTSEGTDEYELTTGNKRTISDSYRELSFTLKNKTTGKEVTVIARAYETGFAYRYVLHGEAGTSVAIKKETSEYILPDSATMWAGYDTAGNYEYEFHKIEVKKLKDMVGTYTAPIIVNDGNMWMLCAEASVFNEDSPYCASHLRTEVGTKSLTYTFGKGTEGDVTMTYKEDGTVQTPWRAIAVSDDMNDIVNCSLFTSLNPAPDDSLFADGKDWIKTGTTAWSWWSESGDDPIEYSQQKDYIDFAAENGWGYVCLDFGWCLWEDYKTKVKELVDYGAEKGVDIMLWYGVNNDNHDYLKDTAGNPAYPTYSLLTTEQMTEQFEWCHSAGVKAVKVDYYENDDQKTMKQMHECAEIAARNKLCVLFHGCTAPKGEHRTYPNILGYEAVKGSEFYKWNGGPSVANCLTYLFGRNVLGGMDFTPVATQVSQIKATAGFQLAQVIAYQSGFINIASSIYKLEGFKGLSLINNVPTQWDDARLLEGYPGTHQTIARQSGDNWFIASMSATPRTVNAKLDFLGDGSYNAYIYKDNADGTDIEIETQTVTKDSVLTMNLPANGGTSVMITKEKLSTESRYDNYDYYEAEDESNLLTGTAMVGKNQYASGMKQITRLGGKGRESNLTFPSITVAEDGVYELRLYYTCKSKRRMCFRINEGETICTEELQSGVNTLAATNLYVTLKKGSNTIDFGYNEATAPDVDRIAISKKPVSKQPTTSSKEVSALNPVHPSPEPEQTPAPAPTVPPASQQPVPTTAVPSGTPAPDIVPSTKPVKISVPKAKIAKAKKAGKKLTVTIKKVKGAAGYQLKAGSNKQLTKNRKTITGKTAKFTLKNWKSRTCYVRVRAYKLDSSGKKVYGAWSNRKKV